MTPDMIGSLVDLAVSFFLPGAFGIYMLLLASRKVGKQPGVDPKFDAWHAKWQNMMPIAGYFTIASAFILTAVKLVRILGIV